MNAYHVPVTMLVTSEAIEDAPLVRDIIRRMELAARGFLGLVRCARCHRPAKCVYTIGGRLYGRTCAVLS